MENFPIKKPVYLYDVFYDGKFIKQVTAYNQNQAISFVKDLVQQTPIKKYKFRADRVPKV